MDSHYDAQILQHTPYAGGPARQFGSVAAGLGALAVRVGRTALPMLKKYALPLIKKIGPNLVQAAIPELKDAISGRKKLKNAVKSSVRKSIAKTFQSGAGSTAGAPRGAALLASGGARPGGGQGQTRVREAKGASLTSGSGPNEKLQQLRLI